MADGREKEAKPVPRDMKRFKLLFTNSRPHVPEGHSAPLASDTTRVLIAKRLRENANASAA